MERSDLQVLKLSLGNVPDAGWEEEDTGARDGNLRTRSTMAMICVRRSELMLTLAVILAIRELDRFPTRMIGFHMVKGIHSST